MGLRVVSVLASLLVLVSGRSPAQAQSPPLELRKGDRVVLIGNTMAERMQHHNHFEALLMTRFPDLDLVVRNLGWSGDTIRLQPRPLNFGNAEQHLTTQQADVVLAFFGVNESFDGEAGLTAFRADLTAYLKSHLGRRYNGRSAPRLALVSPIAQQPIERLKGYVDVNARNRDLARYVDTMRQVAAELRVPFVDLFTPTRQLPAQIAASLTTNGVHLSESGDRLVADLLIKGLGFTVPSVKDPQAFEALRASIRDKNQQFFYRWRPVNAEYVVGRRVEPFGSVNFPGEMKELDRMLSERDARIWSEARGVAGGTGPSKPAAIDVTVGGGR